MASYLVTGSSRGIGLGIVTHLLSRPSTEMKVVFATARDPKNCASLVSLANSPEGLGRIILVTLDVCDKTSISNAVAVIQRALGPKGGLDVLINNAGVLIGHHSIDEMLDEELMQNLQTNAFGVHRVTRAFLPLLRAGKKKKIINL
jgi:NAD(P)-dependent dehydrogenase (short-subunit alcohol dehydrogenase family)